MASSEKIILKNRSNSPHKRIGERSRVDGDLIHEFTIYYKPFNAQILDDQSQFYDVSHKRKPVISRRKFNSHHKPHPEALNSTKEFARSNNLKILRENEIERWAVLEGRIDDIESAFEIDIKAIKIEERQYFYYSKDIKLPKAFGEFVESVSGLNTLPVKARNIFSDGKKLTSNLIEDIGVKPQDYTKFYNFPQSIDGKGQTIGIISLGGGYKKSVLKKYFKDMGIPMPDISWRGVDGAKNMPDDKPIYVKECYMDIQVAGSLAPGAKIVVYFAGNNISNISKALKRAIHDKRFRPTVISISFGGNERDFPENEKETLNQVLHEAAALNVTVLASSGDNGSRGNFQDLDSNISVHLPAAHPLVLSIGGTQIHEQEGVIVDEHVWEVSAMGITMAQSGGGFSKDQKMPKYQIGTIPNTIDHNGKRGIPDVAANASSTPGILFYMGDKTQVSSGTSASTPLWAALIARINQHLNDNGIRNIGFANPILYHEDIKSTFNPVEKGTNGAYEAGKGWDPCTGLGTPNGEKLMQAIHSLFQKNG